MSGTVKELKKKILFISRELTLLYPDAAPFLTFRNPFELLIAVILSAQTTDAQVTRVTPELFRLYPRAAALAGADQSDVERIIRPTGYYRQKARAIRAAAWMLGDEFGGKVPATMDELLLLPGVGRKTANVVLSQIYGAPAIIVDTHFSRVTRRLGLTTRSDPAGIEADLRALVPSEMQSEFSMRINYHGRRCCTARKPACERCPLKSICNFAHMK
jgi:endonuclease III